MPGGIDAACDGFCTKLSGRLDRATAKQLGDTRGTSGLCTGGNHIFVHKTEPVPTQIDGVTLKQHSKCATIGGMQGGVHYKPMACVCANYKEQEEGDTRNSDVFRGK